MVGLIVAASRRQLIPTPLTGAAERRRAGGAGRRGPGRRRRAGGSAKTFTDPRLCAAIVDRLAFGGNIIETGTDSYRLATTRARAEQQPIS